MRIGPGPAKTAENGKKHGCRKKVQDGAVRIGQLPVVQIANEDEQPKIHEELCTDEDQEDTLGSQLEVDADQNSRRKQQWKESPRRIPWAGCRQEYRESPGDINRPWDGYVQCDPE
jgi:hypothetical protein